VCPEVRGARGGTPLLCSPANRMTARNYVSALGEEGCSGCADATRERGPLFLVGVAATASCPLSAVKDFEAKRDLRFRVGVAAIASLVTSADPDAARDLRLRVGVAWELWSTTRVGAAGGDTSVVACAVRLRPSPRFFASWERRSE
jgi:hypothetical protein